PNTISLLYVPASLGGQVMLSSKIFRDGILAIAVAVGLAASPAAQPGALLPPRYRSRHQTNRGTPRLTELAGANATFRMGNSTFGMDPSPGNVKALRIFARGPRGQHTFEYRESSVVNGAIFTGWGGGNWGNPGGEYLILQARYGTSGRN